MKNTGAATNATVTKNGAGTLVWGGNGTMGLRGPIVVNNGVVSCMTENQQDYQGLGTGLVYLGDTTPSNSNPATINMTNGNSDMNPIIVRAGSSGIIAITNDNGNHTFTGPISLSNNLTLSKIVNNGTLSFYGAITGAGGINIGNTGSITVSSVSKSLANVGTVFMGAVNTYSGDTNINSGTLKLGGINTLPFGSGKGNLIIAATTTLDLNQNHTAINGLSGSGTVDNTVAGTPTLTVGNNDQTSSFSGVIKNTAGTLALTKTGSGTLTLGGANLYAGLTTVNAGSLQSGVNNAIKSANAVNVSPTGASATLDLSTFNQTIGGAGLTLGGATATSAASVTGSGGSVLTLSGGATAVTYDATNNPLGSTIGGTTINLANATQTLTVGDSSNVSGSGNELTVTSNINAAGGASALVKAGAGALRLDGAQGYNTLTANAGTTNVNGSLTSLTAAVTVNGTGTSLKFGSVSQTLSSLTIGDGASVTFSSGATSGSFSGGDGAGKSSGLGSPASSFGGGSVVPEPGTIGLLLVGALGVLNRRRRVG